ncbi:hypothetical protein ABGB14_35800 [Nonomuraea sp. B10E15]|uniref:hypothetical protein n=1 Tax=Nonomuraea sp. B10E15 TaxID=3153560 RepID=UPI00325CA565
MSLRYARLFDATVRADYERALTQVKAQLGAPANPGKPTMLPITDITRATRSWTDTPLLKSRLAGGYCLRTAAQGSCAYANICEHCPNFRTDAAFLPVLAAQRADRRAPGRRRSPRLGRGSRPPPALAGAARPAHGPH